MMRLHIIGYMKVNNPNIGFWENEYGRCQLENAIYKEKFMITLFRWFLLKHKEIKWKLAFYQFLDQNLSNPEELQQKLLHEIAEIIHKSNESNINN